MTRTQVRELAPKIQITDDCLISDDQGWFRLEQAETMPECMERAKEVVKQFKHMASNAHQGKTILAVSHSDFLAALYCLITQQTHNEVFCPHNNSLMVIDFEHSTLVHSNGTAQA